MNFGTITNIASTDTRIVQAATAEALQDKIMTALASFDEQTQRITSITLAGGGDGHTFVAIIEGANVADCFGGLLPNIVVPGISVPLFEIRCYLASSAEDLLIAKRAAGQPAGLPNSSPPPALIPYSLIDEQIVGSSKGTRFMGMSVYYLSTQSLSDNVPAAIVDLASSSSLAAGSTFLTFDTVNNISGVAFSLPPPGTAVKYSGGATELFLVDGSMTVQATNPGVIRLDVMQDPSGVQSSIYGGVSETSVLAGGVAIIPFTGVVRLASPSVSPTQSTVGVRVTISTTPAGGGNIVSGQMRLVRQ